MNFKYLKTILVFSCFVNFSIFLGTPPKKRGASIKRYLTNINNYLFYLNRRSKYILFPSILASAAFCGIFYLTLKESASEEEQNQNAIKHSAAIEKAKILNLAAFFIHNLKIKQTDSYSSDIDSFYSLFQRTNPRERTKFEELFIKAIEDNSLKLTESEKKIPLPTYPPSRYADQSGRFTFIKGNPESLTKDEYGRQAGITRRIRFDDFASRSKDVLINDQTTTNWIHKMLKEFDTLINKKDFSLDSRNEITQWIKNEKISKELKAYYDKEFKKENKDQNFIYCFNLAKFLMTEKIDDDYTQLRYPVWLIAYTKANFIQPQPIKTKEEENRIIQEENRQNMILRLNNYHIPIQQGWGRNLNIDNQINWMKTNQANLWTYETVSYKIYASLVKDSTQALRFDDSCQVTWNEALEQVKLLNLPDTNTLKTLLQGKTNTVEAAVNYLPYLDLLAKQP